MKDENPKSGEEIRGERDKRKRKGLGEESKMSGSKP